MAREIVKFQRQLLKTTLGNDSRAGQGVLMSDTNDPDEAGPDWRRRGAGA